MSLSEMLAKNSPIGDKRKTSESEYLRLLGRNTELVDKIKWLKRDNKELQERIDKAIEVTQIYQKDNDEGTTNELDHYIFAKRLLEILKGEDKE